MQITEDRKKRVIDLYINQHKLYAEIAQIEKISPRDIHAIIKEEEARRQKYKQQELSSKAYTLFSEGKTSVQVAMALNLPASKVSKLYREYWDLKELHILNTIFKETNGKIWIILKLYKELIKKRRISIEQVANTLDTAIHKLPYMETLYRQVKDQAEKMQHTIQRLSNDIAAKEYRISLLDKIAFTSEQECKRTEQQIQELTAKKDRMEKSIANILNEESYSKLKQIIKENIRDILSNNKILISTAFAALLQTLKDNPEMANLNYNISIANNDKDNNNNNNVIANYFKANKHTLLDLAQKNYENLVEELTKSVIASAVADSSSSSPSSTS